MRILDTDVCIEILRGNNRVIEKRAALLDRVAITWITVAELSYGAAKSRKSHENQVLVRDFVTTIQVVGLSMPAAEKFGSIKADLERRGQRIADADILIAAVAMTQDSILVTGNIRHYERISGLSIENWIRE